MHSLFVTDLSNYLNADYSLVSGQLLNVQVVSGSILCGFDLAASDTPGAADQETVIQALAEAVSAGTVDIGYPFPLVVDKVCNSSFILCELIAN